MSLTPARTPLVVELVGPAGVGKTALLRTIRRLDATVRAGLSIDRVRSTPSVVWHSLALAPVAAEMVMLGVPAWQIGLLHLVRLRVLPTAVQRAGTSGARAIVLDEGPVFSLTRLAVFQGAQTGPRRLAREWHAALERWIDRLDVVVWLDAPDRVLMERIRRRAKHHRVKGSSDAEVMHFLARYRAAFQYVLAGLTARSRVHLMEMETTEPPPEEVAHRILDALAVLPAPAAS